MTQSKLQKAREYEKTWGRRIPADARPKFHLTPYVGWCNDPNGFSFYKDQFHLFYQSNPYSTVWDSMHWGHAVSDDLIRWTYLPSALAPEESYDWFGIYSGSAAQLPDGRQLLMYTGVRKEDEKDVQTQCIAVGDGLNYEKYAGNPVLDESVLPEGLSKHDFRDPKLWQEDDGSYRCVVATRIPEKEGAILLCSSPDGFAWKVESVLIRNDGRFGRMWECPDFFRLDGKAVLLCSPQDVQAKGYDYHSGNVTLCLVGHLDEQGKHFVEEHDQTVDGGIDFYAPQTTLAPDGRRIMVGWMQNWEALDQEGAIERNWFGQMTLPRELTLRNNRLYQWPVRELEKYRSNRVAYEKVAVTDTLRLPQVEGRTVDLEITLRLAQCEKLVIKFAENEQFETSLTYRPGEELLTLDRTHAGSRRGFIHQRTIRVSPENGEVKLRLILDRFSAELFINGGCQAMTTTLMTPQEAAGISFSAVGKAEMDLVKYDLMAEN